MLPIHFFRKFQITCGLLFLFVAGSLVRASDLPPSFVFNLPYQASQPLPAWLGTPETPQTTFGMLNLPIKATDPNASLLVTLYFEEKQGGFLRIIWGSAQPAQLLTDNFYEGIGMSNQRSLLISPATLAGGGVLTFQCGDSALGIQRIKLEWLENKNGLVSSRVQDTLVTPEKGTTQPAQIFDGQSRPTAPAAWENHVVTVPITDSPERIEDGVEFSVQLDTVPGPGRLVLKEDGLALEKHLAVWINHQHVGTISPAVPDLTDEGYLAGLNASDVYVGWRDGSLFVPSRFLKQGVNTVQFSVEGEAPEDSATSNASATSTPALAVKDVAFQINFLPVTSTNVVVSAPQTNVVTSDTTSTPDLSLPGAAAAATTSPQTSTP